MKTCAIICEFNPLHNGHKHLIDSLKSKGATHIVAIMSGNFTQHSEPSIISKIAKTEIALKSNIDLVIEIPTIYTLSSAERFAYAGVFIADSLGFIDNLAFGIEDDNLNNLYKILEFIDTPKFNSIIKKYLKLGNSFPKSRMMSINDTFGYQTAKSLELSNNILALEYLKALKKLTSDIIPIAIKRELSYHNSESITKNFCSSSYIRKCMKNNNYNFTNYLPKHSYDVLMREINNQLSPADLNTVERAIIYRLKNMALENFLDLPDINEGLENRIFKIVNNSVTITEILQKIKTKRYTMSRIKRIILCAFLGIKKNYMEYNIPYIKILGSNDKGLELLKKYKFSKNYDLPIITRYADVLKYTDEAINFFNLEAHFTDLYNLTIPKILPSGIEKKISIKMEHQI